MFFQVSDCKEGLYPKGDFRPVEMVNGTALLGLEQGVKVRKTTTSWGVHVETLYGRSPGELVTLAKTMADRVVKGLSSKYGVVLGDGTINKRHELGIDDPVASLLNRYFEVSTPKRVIDDSPGEDEGELDHIGRDAAVEYLLMPERVKKLEGQADGIASTLDTVKSDLSRTATVTDIKNIESKVDALRSDLCKLTAVMSKLLNAEVDAKEQIAKIGGGNDYVC